MKVLFLERYSPTITHSHLEDFAAPVLRYESCVIPSPICRISLSNKAADNSYKAQTVNRKLNHACIPIERHAERVKLAYIGIGEKYERLLKTFNDYVRCGGICLLYSRILKKFFYNQTLIFCDKNSVTRDVILSSNTLRTQSFRALSHSFISY